MALALVAVFADQAREVKSGGERRTPISSRASRQAQA